VEKEFERVVQVGTVVDIFGRFFYIDVRAHLDEGAFGHVAAADILVYEDIAGFLKFIRWAEALRILVFAVRVDAVRRAGNEEGVCLAAVLRHVDGSEEMHAVMHGDAVLIFRVMGLDVVLFRRGRCGLCGCGVRGEGNGAEQKYPAESYEGESPFRDYPRELYRLCKCNIPELVTGRSRESIPIAAILGDRHRGPYQILA
jgi:hypothetical protein